MDENKGRKISKSLNLETLGLVGILISAKKKGLLPEIKPLIDELRETVFLNILVYLKYPNTKAMFDCLKN